MCNSQCTCVDCEAIRETWVWKVQHRIFMHMCHVVRAFSWGSIKTRM